MNSDVIRFPIIDAKAKRALLPGVENVRSHLFSSQRLTIFSVITRPILAASNFLTVEPDRYGAE